MIRLNKSDFGSVEIRGVDLNFSDETFVDNYIPVFSERLIYSSVIVIGGSLFPLFF